MANHTAIYNWKREKNALKKRVKKKRDVAVAAVKDVVLWYPSAYVDYNGNLDDTPPDPFNGKLK